MSNTGSMLGVSCLVWLAASFFNAELPQCVCCTRLECQVAKNGLLHADLPCATLLLATADKQALFQANHPDMVQANVLTCLV